ncbi:MAG: O-antigen ligase family protein, partial [Planctomycetota bacterium]
MIHLERALYALAALAAASFGLHTLWVLLETGTTPGLSDALDTLPLTLLTSLPLLIVLTVARSNGWSGLAAASIGWATTTRAVTELPSVSSNHDWGDGLFLAPWVLFATASVTANGRLFSRENEAVYALIAAAVLLLVLATARDRRRTVGAQRVSVALVASFVIWVVAAAVAGSFPAQGLQIASRVAVGALLAWGLSVGLDSSGRRAVLTTMLLLATLTLGMAVHGLIDTAAVESWPRVLISRMRVFGLHPNGIGPYLAASACLAAGLALSRQRLALSRQGVVGACCALVAAASAGALVLTESRASTLGLSVGLGAVVVTALVRVPRRALPIAALVTLPFAAVAAAWLGPTAEGLRAKLDLAATGPSAIGQRYHFWRMALAGLEDSPWLGVGPNQYEALARYAQPSYYDGTSQTLHSHNLELGVAAGAGWPALLLLLGLFYVLLNAWRSSSIDDADRASRFEKSAVLGMAVAVLTANQLDLGQAQQTFVPLVLWVAIGFLASYRTSGATVD